MQMLYTWQYVVYVYSGNTSRRSETCILVDFLWHTCTSYPKEHRSKCKECEIIVHFTNNIPSPLCIKNFTGSQHAAPSSSFFKYCTAGKFGELKIWQIAIECLKIKIW